MSSTKATKRSSRKPWIPVLEEVRQLQGEIRGLNREARVKLYRIVTLLVREVFDNPDWREEQMSRGAVKEEDELLAILDQYVKESGRTFQELRDLLHHYPKQSDWETGDLEEMVQEAINRRRDEKQPPVKRQTAKAADLKAAKERVCLLEQRLKEARSVVDTVKRDAESKIETLEDELSEARARIERLQEDNCCLRLKLAQREVLVSA